MKDVAARLEELRAMEPGWLDGEGSAISPRALADAGAVLPQVFQALEGVNGGIFPTEDGHVQGEFFDGDGMLRLEFTDWGMCEIGTMVLGQRTAGFEALEVEEVEAICGLCRAFFGLPSPA